MNFIQIIRAGIIDNSKCYIIYPLVHSFIDRQPVNSLKLFAGYMKDFDFCTVLRKNGYTYFVRFVFSF